jgi:hypothetical protein
MTHIMVARAVILMAVVLMAACALFAVIVR